MSWAGVFTDELLALKRRGLEFDTAWELALGVWPAQEREIGGVAFPRTLDDEARNAEALAWFRVACREAWHGQRRALAHLPGLIDGLNDVDSSTPARRPLERAAA